MNCFHHYSVCKTFSNKNKSQRILNIIGITSSTDIITEIFQLNSNHDTSKTIQ
ncbi:hypothetical protein CAXC1_220039 [Candidatus Xenohaliotis californiensis]|uniref:Uncharacterized protein n=1 Tax=Candidatus Xenohaliotis californiensis TaxID=84677 RepID=A0ABP0EX13_9RICK|nr:hypothetical protein CAXC1_220039 [Candidatus Xenohaliotis californiensis]